MRAYERLLKYVKISTASNEKSDSHPSTQEQFDLAHQLVEELKQLGLTDACVDEKCYVYATLPATPDCENVPALGLIAHMDTVSDFSEHPVNPIVHEHFDGRKLVLGKSGRELDPQMFPHLEKLKGRTLITSDGTTILGADDKAGIAEIMTLLEELQESKAKRDCMVQHGKLCIGFTPDEEIGAGADYFDVERFGAAYAYTMDGGAEGEIEYENFNAAGAMITITGVNVHPGSAKDVMINASEIACEIQSMLPSDETPQTTEGYEGFYHLVEIGGNVAKAGMHIIIRDHDDEKFQNRIDVLKQIVENINTKYGADTARIKVRIQYRNMISKIKSCFHLIEDAKSACEKAGIVPSIQPIRGGTDGARLSFMGLPCPNLGTGGYAFHGPYEHITIEGMDLTVKMLHELVEYKSLNKSESHMRKLQ